MRGTERRLLLIQLKNNRMTPEIPLLWFVIGAVLAWLSATSLNLDNISLKAAEAKNAHWLMTISARILLGKGWSR